MLKPQHVSEGDNNMEKTLQGTMQVIGHNSHIALFRGVAWGLLGGLAGTMLMDILLMGALLVSGLPAFTCFFIVGDTVARFLSILGIEMAGGVLPGVATHYLIGPLIGAIFGAAVIQFEDLRVDTLKKCILLAVLYVEILAQPILATTPILLKMTAAETVQWFAGSFVMHFIFGVVLGVVVSYGLRLAHAE
jgi:hypothetical protein